MSSGTVWPRRSSRALKTHSSKRSRSQAERQLTRAARTADVRGGLHRARHSPLLQRTRHAAIKTSRHRVLRRTMRANGAGFKRIKGLSAASASPVRADGRSSTAARTHKSRTAWKLGDPQQRPRMLQATPAVEQHEYRNGSRPNGLRPERKREKPDDTREAENGGNQKAARAAQDEPQQ